MPSQGLQKFESNLLVEVDRLIQSHGVLNHTGRGRRGLGHITRSGVLMLCAAWELYVEEVLIECVKYIAEHCPTPHQLSLNTQKELSKATKDSKHELKPLELSGDGWRTVFINHAQTTISTLNTPKSTILDPIFKRFLGVAELSSHWSIGPDGVNKFVNARGDIAHRGRDTQYVTIDSLRGYREQVITTVTETDNFLANHVQETCPDRHSPWRRRNI